MKVVLYQAVIGGSHFPMACLLPLKLWSISVVSPDSPPPFLPPLGIYSPYIILLNGTSYFSVPCLTKPSSTFGYIPYKGTVSMDISPLGRWMAPATPTPLMTPLVLELSPQFLTPSPCYHPDLDYSTIPIHPKFAYK